MWYSVRLFSNRCLVKGNFVKKVQTQLQNDVLRRSLCQTVPHKDKVVILGIETSCDDTGCGIVDNQGNVLGEDCHSQLPLHLINGGIIPSIAHRLHIEHITTVCENALKSADLKLRDVDAIATTVKPGQPLALEIGLRFGKYLSKIGNKPFIPIHHMEAHALTARMLEEVNYPFLALLVSGGHSILAIVNDVDKFYVLGNSTDNSPGEMIDKVARRLKLQNIPDFTGMAGGKAVEMAARRATSFSDYDFPPVMTSYRCCNFSFSGIANTCVRHILLEEKKYNIEADMVIPNVYNLCAAFQWSYITHILQRTQRAIEYFSVCNESIKMPSLVVSGGVACNDLLSKALRILCWHFGFKFVRTPPKLCNDNGVMIAWNGMERWNAKKGVLFDADEIENVQIEHKAPLGDDWRERIKQADLKCKWVKINKKELMDEYKT